MTKIAGSDPHQNVMDPQHWFQVRYFITLKPGNTSYRAYSYTLARKIPRVHAVKQFHLSGLSDAVGKNGDLLNLMQCTGQCTGTNSQGHLGLLQRGGGGMSGTEQGHPHSSFRGVEGVHGFNFFFF
jgi:hypothetical protein